MRYCIILYLMKTFGARLKELRIERKLSHTELGKIIGVNGSTISRWENGVISIKDEDLVRVAKFFGVKTDFLLGIED